MINAQDTKEFLLVAPAILDNVSATSLALDTDGFEYAKIIAAVGATDIAMSALKLQHCDTSGGSYEDITGASFTAPTATDDGKLYGFYVNLLRKKRFIKIVATAGDGSVGVAFTALASLSRAQSVPNDATSRGLAAQVLV
jgi:hypothetical protein